MKTQKVVIILAVVGAAVGALLSGSSPIGVEKVEPAVVEEAPQLVAIHIAGAVVSPGVVWIQEGALIAEVVALAGGALPEADLNKINLASSVHSGDHIEVPSSSGPAGATAGADDGLIGINTADETALQDLPGVGPVLAARIVAYREENGPFGAIEDLLEVSGIGENTLASLRDLVALR